MKIDHGVLCTWVNESEETTQGAREISEKCRDYYDSKQYTAAEEAKMRDRGQAPVVINRIKPKMDGLSGMEKANRTTAKAYPRTPRHNQDSDAATEAVRYVLQDNAYPQTRSSLFDNYAIEGTGGLEVIAETVGKEIRIGINYISWDRIIHDPHSRRKNFSDARYLGQVIWMDYDEAAALYPNGKDVLEDMLSSNSETYDDKPRWMDNTRRRVKIVEIYYRDGGRIKYATFTRGGYLKAAADSPYKDEDGNAEWPYEFQSAFVDREGNRYGAVLQLLDVQDEVNKRRSKALHLMSVRQVHLEKGAVDDVNKVRAELAKPDGVVETVPGMEFEILKTGDMAAAQFNLLSEAKQEIDSVGVNAAMSGKLEGPSSGRALMQRQQAGQTEVAVLFDGLKALDIRVYRKVWNRIRQYWKDEKWIRVTDDEQNVKFVGLNRPMTRGEQVLMQAKAQEGIPPEQLQMLEQQIMNDPMMKESVGRQNDVAQLDVDIIISDAPDVESLEVEQFQGLAEVIKSGAPPMLIEALIQSSAIPKKEQLLKRMRAEPQVPPQVQQQMQQMQEEGQKLTEELQKVTEENQKLKQQDAEGMAKAQADAELRMAELQHKQEIAEKEFALKKYVQDQELDLARKKAFAELQLKRDIANAEQTLEENKLFLQDANDKEEIRLDGESRAAEAAEEKTESKSAAKAEPPAKGITKAFDALAKALQSMAQAQEVSTQIQLETLELAKRPKTVSLGRVQRDDNGVISGATVNTTIQ